MSALNPYTDHEAWFDAQLAAGMSRDELMQLWREMNSVVVMPDGTRFKVSHYNGAAIHLVKAVCEEMGVPYTLGHLDWPNKGDNICIRTPARHFDRVTSSDCIGNMDLMEGAARAALAQHRAGLFGSQPQPAVRRPRP